MISVPDDRKEAEFAHSGGCRSSRGSGTTLGTLRRHLSHERAVPVAQGKPSQDKIPYPLVGGKSFFERREIKDISAYMAVLLNPSDDSSFLRIINTPPRGIGPTASSWPLLSASNASSAFSRRSAIPIIWTPARARRPTPSALCGRDRIRARSHPNPGCGLRKYPLIAPG